MGRYSRQRPQRLAEKLLQIRLVLRQLLNLGLLIPHQVQSQLVNAAPTLIFGFDGALALNLSQTQMLDRLGLTDELFYTAISGNELGAREPTMIEVLRYAQLANVYVDVLIDDKLDLPDEIPSLRKHEGIGR